MSHVVEIESDDQDQQITNLLALKRAAERCGLEFREGQQNFYMYGRQRPPCAHAIAIPAGQQNKDFDKYEIGVVESTKHPGTCSLRYDPYGGSLNQRAGKGLEDLLMFYQMECVRMKAQQAGDQYVEQRQDDGTYIARVNTTRRVGV